MSSFASDTTYFSPPLPQIRRIRPYGFSANYQTVPTESDVGAWDSLTGSTLDTKDKYLLLSVHPRNWVYYITNSSSLHWKNTQTTLLEGDIEIDAIKDFNDYIKTITDKEAELKSDKNWQKYLKNEKTVVATASYFNQDNLNSVWMESFASRNWVKNNYLIEISLSAEQYRRKMESFFWGKRLESFTNEFFNLMLTENQHVSRKLKKLKNIITIENDKSDDESDDERVLKYFGHFLVALKKRYDDIKSPIYQFDVIAEMALNNMKIIDDSTTHETEEKFIKIISEAKIPKHSSKNGGKKKKTKHRKKKTKRRKKKTKKRRKTRKKRRKKR